MSPATERPRILIVDDEESMRDFLSIMLHREGYQVDTAVDGAQAVVHLRDHSYDLVISDIKMPRMTGLELLAHIKERTPETVVLMVTAFSSTDEAVEAMKQGAFEFLTKPFPGEKLRLTLQRALEFARLTRENRELRSELRQMQAWKEAALQLELGESRVVAYPWHRAVEPAYELLLDVNRLDAYQGQVLLEVR